ncbi:ATP-binding SpoIIE family protein phosphatase [Chitinilyticum piscinae]|uniref:Fused response regulator/phosphatase n=1 Tax=Chitinilyticum piscinae TaxID=2866724 RepID=A0A8J7FNR3_9NEIS|nr:fused response regulator/phosphatase [Chitinilyticum piscinae]MBE9610186.1 fused response regulator/phosphatase [Chitinilyticum piscinae]
MKILVVDDTDAVLLLISRFVEALGHSAVQARNGQEAIDTWRAHRPDLVLMDMMMPVMSGPEAAAIIKAESGAVWVPIVFVTGVGEENRLAEAIEQGADDYINKPVNFRVLEAKLKAFSRTLDLNRQVVEQSTKLADYYDRAEEEKRVARHLIEQMVNAERLSDPGLEYWLSPAESLSGDLIAAARTPGQVLHVLLADGIGHGLTAALNVLPLTQPFYSMTEKGYSISDILAEMNNKIRQVLPVGRFVAVTLLALDEANDCVEIWNGGMPALQILDPSGRLLKSVPSSNLPLGIIPSHSMDFVPVRHYYDQQGLIVACSDGLIEAHVPGADAYGFDRLLGAIAGNLAGNRIDSVKDSLAGYLQGHPHHDDVSLVLMAFGGDTPPPATQDHGDAQPASDFTLPALLAIDECKWRYSLTLGADELRYINTVPFMMTFVNEIRALNHSQSDVFLILTELFVNAVDHGLLRMDSRLKHSAAGMEEYLLERSQRLANLQEGRIEIDLAGLDYGGSELLQIRVKDSGPGFNWAAWSRVEAGEPQQAHGRGILLLRALCSGIQFVGNGSEVLAFYRPHSGSDALH